MFMYFLFNKNGEPSRQHQLMMNAAQGISATLKEVMAYCRLLGKRQKVLRFV